MNIEIPKVVWMLWFQGWENAPPVVQKCKATWLEHNPDWTIHFLTMDTLPQFIDLESILPRYKEKNMPPEALSNVIRLALLIRYGGVWADSTLYCTRPLNEWLPRYTSASGFFAFANPGPDRMLSNWFIAASPDHIISGKWHEECKLYWSTRLERHTYHWVHYLFSELYEKDEIVKELWDKTPKYSADAPHYFLPYDETLYEPVSRKVKAALVKPYSPVFKLTFRYDEKKITTDSVIQYLLSDKKEKDQTKCLVIVGMHRSGTSLTTSLLQHSGLDIGERLMAASTGNMKGHYENLDFFNFHRNVLENHQSHPDGWDEIEIEQLSTEEQADAKEIIELNKSGLWGWKDPRTTLFLNVWATLLPEAYFLFVYRSPVETVDSFFRRGTDEVIMENPEKAIDVWIHYNKVVLKQNEKLKDRSLLMHIDSFIQDYPECVRMINKKFNLSLKPERQDIFDQELFYNDPELHRIRAKRLYELKPEARTVYQELIGKSWHAPGIDPQKELILEQNASEVFFTQWKNQHLQIRELKQQHTSKIENLLVEIQGLHLHEEQLKQQHDREIGYLKKILVDRDQFGLDREAEVEWMQRSVFWKMRNAWHKLKSLVGIKS